MSGVWKWIPTPRDPSQNHTNALALANISMEMCTYDCVVHYQEFVTERDQNHCPHSPVKKSDSASHSLSLSSVVIAA